MSRRRTSNPSAPGHPLAARALSHPLSHPHLPLPADLGGFQGIQYYTNSHSRDALGKDGYLYDATLIESYASYSPTSPNANKMVWPFTGARRSPPPPPPARVPVRRATGVRLPLPPHPPPRRAADAGIPLDCGYYGPPIAEGCKPTEKHPGLWIVPQAQMQCGEGCVYGIAGEGSRRWGRLHVCSL